MPPPFLSVPAQLGIPVSEETLFHFYILFIFACCAKVSFQL